LITILNNWTAYFSDAYNKLKVQKTAVVGLETTRLFATDVEFKQVTSSQLAKERIFEIDLTRQERE
jgi:hypothetical protein